MDIVIKNIFWTISYDVDIDTHESDFNNDVMIQSFLEAQKQSRSDAKLNLVNKNTKNKGVYVDQLIFWKENEKKFLQLSRVAKAFLGIPVTSAYVERFFSKTFYIMRPHRRCMQDEFAENLFFCKENLNFL